MSEPVAPKKDEKPQPKYADPVKWNPNWPVDPKTELLADWMKSKKLIPEGELAILEMFDPQRKDYLIAHMTPDNKAVTSFDTMTGKQIRDSYALLNGYVIQADKKLDEKGAKLLQEAIETHPLYKELDEKTTKSLIEALTITEENRHTLQREREHLEHEGDYKQRQAYRTKILHMAVGNQVATDTHEAFMAACLVAEAKRIKDQQERARKKKELEEAQQKEKPQEKKEETPAPGMGMLSPESMDIKSLDLLNEIRREGTLLSQAMEAISGQESPQRTAFAKATSAIGRKGGLAA